MNEYYAKSWEEGEQRAPNLTKVITRYATMVMCFLSYILLARFADMSYWVATTILLAKDADGHPNERARSQTISRFIHTMNVR